MAVALLNEAVGFLGNILFQDVCVPGNDRLDIVIEHDGSGVEITVSLLDPLGRPDAPNDMRVPVLLGVGVDKTSGRGSQVGAPMGFASLSQKKMLFLMRRGQAGDEHGTPDIEVVLKHRHEGLRKRQVKDVFSPPFAPHFEFITTERDAPFALIITMEVLSYLHFTDIALPVRNIGPET